MRARLYGVIDAPSRPVDTIGVVERKRGPFVLKEALALHRKGQLAEAAALYRNLLIQDPKNADALHLLGVIEYQKNHSLAAIELFDRAIELNPRDAAFFSNRGLAFQDLKRLEEALASYERAILIKPDYAEAFYNRGNALKELKRLEEALVSYERALAIKPDYADALTNRGLALQDMQRLEEALASYDRALAIMPNDADTLCNRGNALQELKRLEEALASYERALSIKPDYAEALNNRGHALQDLKRLEEALASYDRALAIRPGYAEALYNHGRAQLLCGRYREGWVDHEWRWETKDFPSKPPRIDAPKWQGEDIAGRSILIFGEQGLGDVIQFARFLPLLIEHGAKVTFLGPIQLIRLLKSMNAEIDCIGSLAGNETFDFQCALMSLPLRLGTDLESIPDRIPYLKPEAGLAGRWKQRIGEPGFKIGIAWQGKPEGKIDRGRSVPLAEFIPLTRLPGIRLIGLQKNHGLDQLKKLPPSVTVETLGAEFDNGPDAFIDTAAVMSTLDLVITSDTSIAHLAGALGRPTWVALQYVPDWRWMLDRSDSPWYPAMRLFRQNKPGNWSGVFQEIIVELNALLATKPAQEQP